MFDKIRDILFGKKFEWNYSNLSITYDITKHPDVSDSSPIKEFTMSYLFRYCPKYKILQKSYTLRHNSNYSDVDIDKYKGFLEISNLIKNSDISYNRERKLKKLKIS